MEVYLFILRYLKDLFSLWTAIAFMVFDIITFAIGWANKDWLLPPWVYWTIAGTGFVIANIQLYYQLESKIRKFESEKAEIDVKVIKTDMYFFRGSGLDNRNIPKENIIVVDLELENSGKEEGCPIFEIDTKRTTLPELFSFSKEQTNGFSLENLKWLDGRSTIHDRYYRHIDVTAKNPSIFLSELSGIKVCDIVVNYYTKRIGKPSKNKSFLITVDISNYRKQVLDLYDEQNVVLNS